MEKFVSIDIDKKDCKGIYLLCDTDSLIPTKDSKGNDKFLITSSKQADKLIKDTIFKLQLKTRVDGKLFKKIFTFSNTNKNKKTFLQALESVAGQREDLREKIKVDGTVREIKEVSKEDNNRDTFLDIVNDYLALKEISLRARTLISYKTALLTHCKELHNKEISKITTQDIQNIVNNLISKKRQAGTIKTFIVTLKVFFKKQKSNIDFDDLELPEVDNQIEYTLSLEETKTIIRVLREYSKIDLGNGLSFYQFEEMKNIFAFSLTGRRISEILSLKFSNFNFETNSYFIPSTTAKGKKQLDFILDDYLLKAIKSQAKLRNVDLDSNSDKKVFTYNRESARLHFQNLLRELGLPRLRLHDIRHMLATTLVQNGVPIQDISRMLGHSSIAITEQRYAKTSKEQASRATNAFNSLMED